MWLVVNATLRPLYPLEIDRVPIVQEVGWAPGPVWADAENLALTGIRSPDPHARSESIYRLRYPGPICFSLYPLNLKLGVSQGRSRPLGDNINILSLPGFEQPSIQPRGLVMYQLRAALYSYRILPFGTTQAQLTAPVS